MVFVVQARASRLVFVVTPTANSGQVVALRGRNRSQVSITAARVSDRSARPRLDPFAVRIDQVSLLQRTLQSAQAPSTDPKDPNTCMPHLPTFEAEPQLPTFEAEPQLPTFEAEPQLPTFEAEWPQAHACLRRRRDHHLPRLQPCPSADPQKRAAQVPQLYCASATSTASATRSSRPGGASVSKRTANVPPTCSPRAAKLELSRRVRGQTGKQIQLS